MNPINTAYKYIVETKPLTEWSLNELNAVLRAYADTWESSYVKPQKPSFYTKVYLKGVAK
jgi:hypothetical protein